MNEVFYHLKSQTKSDLWCLRQQIEILLAADDSLEGFHFGTFTSLLPSFFRFYSHIWCKHPEDLLKL